MSRKVYSIQILFSLASYRIPLAVTHVLKCYDGFFDSVCPRCHGILPYEYVRFCPLCGQRLLWALLDDAIELNSLSTLSDNHVFEHITNKTIAALIRYLLHMLYRYCNKTFVKEASSFRPQNS